MFSKRLTNHLKGFGSGFTELHAKLDVDRTKQEVEKALV
jgi:hypothetical protein